MDVREATPEDGEAIRSLVDRPLDVERLIVDRRVLVADDAETMRGFLAYEAIDDAVHVSALAGEPSVVDSLLAEPRRFAERESLPLEIVIPEDDTGLIDAVERAGFEAVGSGPRFDGTPSKRFRDTA